MQKSSVIHQTVSTRSRSEMLDITDLVQEALPEYMKTRRQSRQYDAFADWLRKEMELRMREICAGTKTKREVVEETVEKYRLVYAQTLRRIDVLKAACRRYVFEQVDE